MSHCYRKCGFRPHADVVLHDCAGRLQCRDLLGSEAPVERARCRCRGPAATGARGCRSGVRSKRVRAPVAARRRLRRTCRGRRCAGARGLRSSAAPARSTPRAREELDPLVAGAVPKIAAKRSFSAGHCVAVHLLRGVEIVELQDAQQVRRRTSARTTRSTRTRRRRSRTRCRSARRRRGCSCRASPQPPIASMPKKMLISCALPSTIAASTVWPLPDVARSTSAARMPITTSSPPPPKSASRLIGGTGGPSASDVPRARRRARGS